MRLHRDACFFLSTRSRTLGGCATLAGSCGERSLSLRRDESRKVLHCERVEGKSTIAEAMSTVTKDDDVGFVACGARDGRL